MKQINQAFERIIKPENFIKNFKSEKEFETWCRTGDVDSLQKMLVLYQKANLTRYCDRIKKVIKYKKENGN